MSHSVFFLPSRKDGRHGQVDWSDPAARAAHFQIALKEGRVQKPAKPFNATAEQYYFLTPRSYITWDGLNCKEDGFEVCAS